MEPKNSTAKTAKPNILKMKTQGVIFNNLGTVITNGFNCELSWYKNIGVMVKTKQFDKEVSRVVCFSSINYIEVE